MIPGNIKREHILKAIEEIKRNGVPEGRSSRKFLLEFEGRYYPPKYVISLANRYANGEELDPSKFGGGKETNDFLKGLGFNITDVSGKDEAVLEPSKGRKEKSLLRTQHNERCRRCKEIVKELLEKIYGRVEQNYKFDVGTHPEDFEGTPIYAELKEIYTSLQNYRGFRDFVRTRTLPNCDFFVPDPGFIVEFDESQHFTTPRKLTLKRYPEGLGLGFSRERWIALCEQINARDDKPPYRDEQRAWYDTLRDFLPIIKGLKPTVRLFSRDLVWCGLDPDDPKDVEKFREMIERNTEWKIEVREDPNPLLARIIIAGEWGGRPEEAKRLLEDIYDRWPKGKRVKFLITCGGFLQFDWPKSISTEDIGDNRDPNDKVINILVAEAERLARFVLSGGLSGRLGELTDYMTLGIDSYKERISTTRNYINQPHVELVFLVDLRNNKLYWTGKSYPTPNQQRNLVRISDLRSHFFDLDVGKVMVLGCHDLSVFNPRSKNARGWRKKVNEEFRELAREERPIYVLHHPHTAVKVRTWLNAWNLLRRMVRSVKVCAGAGRFYEPDRDPSEYDGLDEVLKHTKCGNSLDFVVYTKFLCRNLT